MSPYIEVPDKSSPRPVPDMYLSMVHKHASALASLTRSTVVISNRAALWDVVQEQIEALAGLMIDVINDPGHRFESFSHLRCSDCHLPFVFGVGMLESDMCRCNSLSHDSSPSVDAAASCCGRRCNQPESTEGDFPSRPATVDPTDAVPCPDLDGDEDFPPVGDAVPSPAAHVGSGGPQPTGVENPAISPDTSPEGDLVSVHDLEPMIRRFLDSDIGDAGAEVAAAAHDLLYALHHSFGGE